MLDYLKFMDKYGLARSGIVHIGANYAGEARFYDAYGDVPVAFFEPGPEAYQNALVSTAKFPRQRVFNECCSDRDGETVAFSISSNRGMSSSMYPLGRHGELAPGVRYIDRIEIKTVRAETILRQHYAIDEFNLAVIDTQGADLRCLKGLGVFLEHIDAVQIEISDQPLYEGGARFDDIYQYLNKHGFVLAMLESSLVNIGNAFFKRRDPSHLRAVRNAISVGKPSFMSSVHLGNEARFGNDGMLPEHPLHRKYFHTKREWEPWWKVDLGQIVPIRRIYLFDWVAQSARADTLLVEVSDDDANYTVVYDRIKKPTPRTAKGMPANAYGLTVVKPDNVCGRWVRLRLHDTDDFLHMRQVAITTI